MAGWLAMASIAHAAPTAHEPSAGDLATARSALVEGVAMRDKGDLPGALARLTTAWDLVQTPVTGFELGKTHLLQGRILQAHELFKKVVRMPPALEESSRSATAREESARVAAEIEPRIPSLRLKLTLPEGATAIVKLDDEIIAMADTVTPRAVDPGKHELVAKAGDGPEEHVVVVVAEGETKTVELAPQWVIPKPPPKDSAAQVVVVRQTNSLVFIGFSVATAGLVLSSFSALMAVNAADRAKARCGNDYCPDHVRTGEISEMNSWVVATVAGGITALVFAGIGIASLSKPVDQKVMAIVSPTKGGAMAGFEGRF
ncbi:hypothetical protein AKJ09_04656 [Labilithrix luteola]|uniref:PEGA domain-containing protein n=1 Tax=Labilithrix luteola TaxID=1391654 RepID=A0A0K1PWU9_9BACT|nr:hypothetical protein AKJ09_04656 [Labilithrix luteola]